MGQDAKQIGHVVMWKLNGKDEAEKKAQGHIIVSAFEQIKATVEGLIRLDVGVNIISASDAWDVALYMVFANREALQLYLGHPSHHEIKKMVGPMRSDRAQADFEIDFS